MSKKRTRKAGKAPAEVTRSSKYQKPGDTPDQIIRRLKATVARQRKALIAAEADRVVNESAPEFDDTELDLEPPIEQVQPARRASDPKPRVRSIVEQNRVITPRGQFPTLETALKSGNTNRRIVSAKPALPSHFAAVIHPTPHVKELFQKRMRGKGGFQSFHAMLASRMQENGELVLDPAEFHRLVNYAANYGEGGFQSALRWLTTLWVSENLPQIASH